MGSDDPAGLVSLFVALTAESLRRRKRRNKRIVAAACIME
jgi:MYXO-CTERM domain-containing protein